MVLKRGSKGAAVADVQRLLKITADGDYGASTEKAVIAFQRKAGLVVDGAAGPRTLDALRAGERSDKALTEGDIANAAERLGVSASHIRAVCAVESDGSGFMSDGRPDVLFERHVFYQRLKAAGRDVADLAARFPNLVAAKRGGYAGGMAEWGRLNSATTIDRAIAFESASWGLFQIMGYHWRNLGYDSAEHFAERMQSDEGEHLAAFVRFVEKAPMMLRALRESRWAAFARLYNGPAYSENLYDAKLAAAFAKAERLAK